MAPHTATETTPLLTEVPPESIDDGAIEQQQAPQNEDNGTVLVDAPSTKKLVVILGSVYLGVFLGALGRIMLDNDIS
jgi:hypothetical protein